MRRNGEIHHRAIFALTTSHFSVVGIGSATRTKAERKGGPASHSGGTSLAQALTK